jgi:hypothetical protein
MDDASLRTKIIEHLEAVRPRGLPVIPISDSTGLWYDLGIYGDELFDFAMWARDALGKEPNLDIEGHAPAKVQPYVHVSEGGGYGGRIAAAHATRASPSFRLSAPPKLAGWPS